MRVASAILIVVGVVSPVLPVFAQDAPDIVVEGQRPEKKVCKSIEPPTGTRMRARKICQTKAEWRLAEQTAQRNVDRDNQRLNADRSQTLNEQGVLGRKLPH